MIVRIRIISPSIKGWLTRGKIKTRSLLTKRRRGSIIISKIRLIRIGALGASGVGFYLFEVLRLTSILIYKTRVLIKLLRQ